MKRQDFEKRETPGAPGVYFFKKGQEVLYIGRATSLKDRLKSYFADDLIAARGPLIVDMVTRAADCEWLTTDSVLEAVILEANLIKKMNPRYNIREKDDKSFNWVVITKEEFPRLLIVRGKTLSSEFPKKEIKYAYGPYPHGLVLRDGMKIIRKIFPFRDSCTPAQGRECFNSQIGLCPGVCISAITKFEYSRRIQRIKMLLEGTKSVLLGSLEREMKMRARQQEFEKASELQRIIFALTHIQDISLIKREEMEIESPVLGRHPTFRIEGYDIAHISGTSNVGVMVVIEDGHVKKSGYRMFRVRTNKKGSDTDSLREVLDRRLNHPQWPFPNIIVVDGGEAQRNTALAVLRVRGVSSEVVAVTKDERHRPARIIGGKSLIDSYQKEILLLNSEAHRFALRYHRAVRSRMR